MPSQSTRETLLRQWQLLLLLPRHPRTCTIATLHAALADAGFDVTRRTVERDLQKLSMAGFPVTWEVRDGLQQWTLSGTAGHRLPALPDRKSTRLNSSH